LKENEEESKIEKMMETSKPIRNFDELYPYPEKSEQPNKKRKTRKEEDEESIFEERKETIDDKVERLTKENSEFEKEINKIDNIIEILDKCSLEDFEEDKFVEIKEIILKNTPKTSHLRDSFLKNELILNEKFEKFEEEEIEEEEEEEEIEKRVVISCTGIFNYNYFKIGLDNKETANLKKALKKFNGTFSSKVDENVTHIITKYDQNKITRRTIKYACGIVK
jgi:hypothetical protein